MTVEDRVAKVARAIYYTKPAMKADGTPYVFEAAPTRARDISYRQAINALDALDPPTGCVSKVQTPR